MTTENNKIEFINTRFLLKHIFTIFNKSKYLINNSSISISSNSNSNSIINNSNLKTKSTANEVEGASGGEEELEELLETESITTSSTSTSTESLNELTEDDKIESVINLLEDITIDSEDKPELLKELLGNLLIGPDLEPLNLDPLILQLLHRHLEDLTPTSNPLPSLPTYASLTLTGYSTPTGHSNSTSNGGTGGIGTPGGGNGGNGGGRPGTLSRSNSFNSNSFTSRRNLTPTMSPVNTPFNSLVSTSNSTSNSNSSNISSSVSSTSSTTSNGNSKSRSTPSSPFRMNSSPPSISNSHSNSIKLNLNPSSASASSTSNTPSHSPWSSPRFTPLSLSLSLFNASNPTSSTSSSNTLNAQGDPFKFSPGASEFRPTSSSSSTSIVSVSSNTSSNGRNSITSAQLAQANWAFTSSPLGTPKVSSGSTSASNNTGMGIQGGRSGNNSPSYFSRALGNSPGGGIGGGTIRKKRLPWADSGDEQDEDDAEPDSEELEYQDKEDEEQGGERFARLDDEVQNHFGSTGGGNGGGGRSLDPRIQVFNPFGSTGSTQSNSNQSQNMNQSQLDQQYYEQNYYQGDEFQEQGQPGQGIGGEYYDNYGEREGEGEGEGEGTGYLTPQYQYQYHNQYSDRQQQYQQYYQEQQQGYEQEEYEQQEESITYQEAGDFSSSSPSSPSSPSSSSLTLSTPGQIGESGLNALGAYSMTPFDVLISIFKDSPEITESLLEEALRVSSFEVERALEWIICSQVGGGGGGSASGAGEGAGGERGIVREREEEEIDLKQKEQYIQQQQSNYDPYPLPLLSRTVVASGSRPLIISRNSFEGFSPSSFVGGRGNKTDQILPGGQFLANRAQDGGLGGKEGLGQVDPLGKGVGGRVCRYYLNGTCLRSDCKFSHDVGKAVCKFWLRGHCLKGEGGRCDFLHSIPPIMREEYEASKRRRMFEESNQHLQSYDDDSNGPDLDFPTLGSVRTRRQANDNQLQSLQHSQFNSQFNSQNQSRNQSQNNSGRNSPIGFGSNNGPNGGGNNFNSNNLNENLSRLTLDPTRSRFAGAVKFGRPNSSSALSNSNNSNTRTSSNQPSQHSSSNSLPQPRYSARLHLRPPALLPTLPTGSALSALYTKYRSSFLELGNKRNKCLVRAAECWKKGDGAGAKKFSKEAQDWNKQVLIEGKDSANKIVEERKRIMKFTLVDRNENKSGSTDDSSDRKIRGKELAGGIILGVASTEVLPRGERLLTAEERTECCIDLHGLHSDEAVSFVAEFLQKLEKERYLGLAYIIIGQARHSGKMDPGGAGVAAGRLRLEQACSEFLSNQGYPFKNFSGIIAVDSLR